MLSVVQKRGQVTFPAHIGERVYMQPFTKRAGLPQSLRRWQQTVDQMLDGIDTDGPIYLMVDQKRVPAATAHRRPGLHVDGNWMPAIRAHGNPSPGHNHPVEPPRPRHIHAGKHGGHTHASYTPEAILLASNVMGARAYAGQFSGTTGPDGACDGIDTSRMDVIDMEPFQTWAGNVTMVHESIPLSRTAFRTVVRLNVPGWQPPVSSGSET